MANVNLTALDTVMLNYFEPAITKCLITDISNWNRWAPKAGNFVGRYHYFTLKNQRNQGIGAGSEEGAMPTAGVPAWVQHYFSPKYNYLTVGITGQAIHLGLKGGGGLVNAMDEAVSDAVESFTVDMNRQLWGHGSGKLAQVNGAVSSSATVAVDSIGGTRWLQPGMLIDAHNAGGTKQINGISISSKDSITGITLASAQSCDDDSWLYRKGARNIECMGLEGIVDDGTWVATFQALARSSYDQLCAYVLGNSGTGRALTESLLMQAVQVPWERAGGKVDSIIIHPKSLRSYSESLITQSRMFTVSPNASPAYTGGYAVEGLSFGGVPFELDRNCPWNAAFCVQKDTIGYYYAGPSPIGWINDDGMIMRQVAGYDYIVGHMRAYGNMASRDPMKNSVIRDISYVANDFIEWL